MAKLRQQITAVLDGFGEQSLYLKSTTVPRELLSAANLRMKHSIVKLGEAIDKLQMEQVEKCLGNMFGFLMVRIVGASRLPGTAPGAYIAGYLGDRGGEVQVRTKATRHMKKPRWEEQFCLPVRMDDHKVTLEVLASNVQGSISSLQTSRMTRAESRQFA